MSSSNYEESVIDAVKKIMPTVVSIVVGEDYQKILKERPYELMVPHGDHIDPPPAEETLPHTKGGKIKVGGGTGFIVDETGLILTNKHVVSNPEAEYLITTASDDTYPAKVLARDPLNDVAVLKIDAEGLTAAPLGNSNKVELGQTVLAMGTALGEFQNTVSLGIVSGLSRFITAMTDIEGHAERLRGLIQTDAAINPGNSGGPLVNLHAEIIGINSAVVFGAQNIGFAIPINKAKRDLEELKRYGRIRRPFLGVRYVQLNPSLQKRYNLPTNEGAYILREGTPERPAVVPKSAADRAGLRESDVIVEINKTRINEKVGIEDILEKIPLGEKVPVKIIRNGREKNIVLTAEERTT